MMKTRFIFVAGLMLGVLKPLKSEAVFINPSYQLLVCLSLANGNVAAERACFYDRGLLVPGESPQGPTPDGMPGEEP